MSTTLAVRFPWGRYHATPWGRNVNEATIEWPPSTWRLLRALYATWKARAPHLDEEVVLSLLGALSTPPDYVLPPYTEAHTRHYLPDVAFGSDKAIDAFAVMGRGAELFVRWPVALTDAQRTALAELAEVLPYLGRAESICEARLVQGELTSASGLCQPVGPSEEPAGSVRLLVPERPLDVEALTARTTDIRGRLRHIDPPGTFRVSYERPAPALPAPTHVRTSTPSIRAFRWAIATPARPSRKAAVTMAEVLRHACMSRYGRRFDQAVSPILAGKDAEGRPLEGHHHAHYLALAADPVRSGNQRLDTLVLWAPGGLGERELEVLGSLHHLRGFAHVSDFRPCRLGLEAYGSIDQVAPELLGPSAVWESHTPFSPPRHGKRRAPWEEHMAAQVTEELGRREVPAPASVDVVPGDWVSYRTHRHTKNERLANARRAGGLRLTFPEPVAGPIAIGALSHFGLGLFLPKP